MTKRKKTVILLSILGVLFLGIVAYFLYSKLSYKKPDFKKIDLTGVNKIMIVAHPDDETMWGFSHLMEDDYLVVCLTGGDNPIRREEFKEAMDKTHDKYIILNYPDKCFKKRDDWSKASPKIKKDVEKLLALKDWEMIVTHNPDGEYGHQQHKMTNKIVCEVYNNNYKNKNSLYYFGKYYPKNDHAELESFPQISAENYDEKLNVIENIYKSQSFLIEKFGHMVPYEEFTLAKDFR